jgi:TrmH family RNA methyltransferase
MKIKLPLLAKHFLQLKKDKTYRDENQSVLIESSKLIKELNEKKLVKNIISSNPDLVPKDFPQDKLLIVSSTIIERITLLEKSEGILAEVEKPKYQSLKDKKRIIAFDGLQDPGNLGTLLRSALAFGFDGALLINNTCDPFNDKALRAARGATFFLPIQQHHLEELTDFDVLIADLEGEQTEKINLKEKFILVLGNEAHGPSKELIGTKVTLPMHNKVESLNVAVAGSILMYLLTSKSL